jgi:hypothetical protein
MIEDLSLQGSAAEWTLPGLPNEHFIFVENAELGAGDSTTTRASKDWNSTPDDGLECWIAPNMPRIKSAFCADPFSDHAYDRRGSPGVPDDARNGRHPHGHPDSFQNPGNL